MRKSLRKAVLLATLLGVSMGLLFWRAWPLFLWNAYLAALIDKDRLLRETPGPRILLVGGSNLAFGVDSERVEQSTGRKTINCGLHGALGLQFMLNQAQANLREGDVVVIAPEYQTTLQGDPLHLYSAACCLPRAWEFIPCDWTTRARIGLTMIQLCLVHVKQPTPIPRTLRSPSPANCVYCWEGFNERGDLVSHLNAPSPPRPLDLHLFRADELASIGHDLIRAMNAFHALAQTKGARVFYSNTPLHAERYKLCKAAVEEYADLLHKSLAFPVIDQQEDNLHEDGEFYDTINHLTAAGRSRRTDRLIAALQNQLKSTP